MSIFEIGNAPANCNTNTLISVHPITCNHNNSEDDQAPFVSKKRRITQKLR